MITDTDIMITDTDNDTDDCCLLPSNEKRFWWVLYVLSLIAALVLVCDKFFERGPTFEFQDVQLKTPLNRNLKM